MVNALNNDVACMVIGGFKMKVKVFSTDTDSAGVSLVMRARRECFVGSDGCNSYIAIYENKMEERKYVG
jgi:hypothetical protein